MELMFTDEYANILLLANGLILLFYLAAKKKKKQRAMKFGNYETLQKVAGKNFLKSSNIILFIKMLALTSLIVGISSPVIVQEVQSTGTDYVVAIDSSSPMLVSDIEPNRFDAAKDVSQDFITQTTEDTSIGVISFAGTVEQEKELTKDREELHQSIEDIELGDEAGTALGDAIQASSSMLLESNQSKSVIMVTKGGQTVGTEINESVEYAQSQNVEINTVGIGEAPEENATTDTEFGTIDGENATEAQYPNLDTEELFHVSNSTGGDFITVGDEEELEDAIMELERTTVETDISVYFIFLAALLIVTEWLLGSTRYSILP